MIVRLLFAVALSSLFFTTNIAAQVEIKPLSGYEALADRDAAQEPLLEKVACAPIDETAFTRVRPGASLERLIRPDTFSLNGDITYSCQGCNTAGGGSALLRRDTLIYTADPDVEEEIDTLTVNACNGAGDCGKDLRIIIVVQRAGRTVMLTSQSVQPGERLELAGPDDAFALKAACRSIESCAPDYLGRDQRFNFLTAQRDGNDFAYTAARYGGRDAICVTLCTAFGLCDVYRTELVINRPTLGLPFVDDFSAGGFRPDATLWQDRDVLVNRTFAVGPPSIGVATFDAVDSDGTAYEPMGNASRTTARDYLTSAALRVSGQQNVALSFYLQPRGLGNRPELQDSFLVQFLHPDGDFRTVLGVGGLPITTPSSRPFPFTPYAIPLPAEYLYDGFVFRFVNKSSERGAVDMWHVDYVRVDRTGNDVTNDDLALTRVPGSVLGPLTSLPLRHFQAAGDDLLRPDLQVGASNVADRSVGLGTKFSEITVRRPDRSPIVTANMADANVFGLPATFAPQTLAERSINPDWMGFDAIEQYLNSLPLTEEPIALTTDFSLIAEDNFENLSQGYQKLRFNNSTTSTTILDEYMSYDDGSAEATIEVTEGTSVLQRYTAYVADDLKGIQVRIPRGLLSLGSQALRLVVYDGDAEPGELIYSEDFDVVIPEDIILDSLEGFTTYIFDEALPLPAGPFFVGWEQQRSTVKIGIGYDRNSEPAAASQYFNFGSGWQELRGSVSGTLMLRPLLGGFEGFTTSTDGEAPASRWVTVFPNPTRGSVRLQPVGDASGARLNARLYNAAGALLLDRGNATDLDLSNFPNGLYLLELSDGARRSYHKIVRN